MCAKIIINEQFVPDDVKLIPPVSKEVLGGLYPVALCLTY
jgi:hypothetical protein